MKTKNCNIYAAASLAFIFFMVLASCESDDFQKLDKKDWQLVWNDEFAGPAGTLPDAGNWAFDIGRGEDGWGNQEQQSYTNSTQNVSLNGEGQLVITAIQDGSSFTSARIKTQGLFSQKYGRFEARIKTPYGPGIWPAFWLLGENIDEVGWPHCGEIDIMEKRGQQPHIVHGSLHGPGYSAGNPLSASYTLQNGRFDTDFNIFAIEWDEEKIDFFVNDFLYFRIKPEDAPGDWAFDQPFFILLNLAVGGTYVGFPLPETPFPQQMVIDYVRVYRERN